MSSVENTIKDYISQTTGASSSSATNDVNNGATRIGGASMYKGVNYELYQSRNGDFHWYVLGGSSQQKKFVAPNAARLQLSEPKPLLTARQGKILTKMYEPVMLAKKNVGVARKQRSDERYKHDIDVMYTKGGVEWCTWVWDTCEAVLPHLRGTEDSGVIAQQLLHIYPEFVYKDEHGLLVDYVSLVEYTDRCKIILAR